MGGRPPVQKKLMQRHPSLPPIAEIPLPAQPVPAMVSAFSGIPGGSPLMGILGIIAFTNCLSTAIWGRLLPSTVAHGQLPASAKLFWQRVRDSHADNLCTNVCRHVLLLHP